MDNGIPTRPPLYKEAVVALGVSASDVAGQLNPGIREWLWPGKTGRVSIAALTEIFLTATFAVKAGRQAELRAYLASKGLQLPADPGAKGNGHNALETAGRGV